MHDPLGRLSAQHREAVESITRLGAATAFEPGSMRQQDGVRVALLSDACPSEQDLLEILTGVSELVRWWRAPGYWVADALQRVTKLRSSRAHVGAALVFADAQMQAADDLAFHSTEVAWRALRLVEQRGEAPSEAWLQEQQQMVLHRLRTQHRFYARWTRPVDYLDCNPLTSHLENSRVVRDLRECYPGETDQLSSAMAPQERAAVLETVANEALEAGDTYHWLTARRLAAMEVEGLREFVRAEELYRSCLGDARDAGLESEVGHLLRSHGWVLMQLWRLDEASVQMEAAVRHEQPVGLYAYWAALGLRELGDIRNRTSPSGGATAFAEGRRLLDVVMASGGPPAGPVCKQQMVRSYGENALMTAMLTNDVAAALAEIEAASPRQASEARAEFEAISALDDGAASWYPEARQTFHRHLTTVPASFEQYLHEMDEAYAARRRYLEARNRLSVLAGRTSDDIAARILRRTGDDRLILAFSVTPRPTSCALLVDVRSGSHDWVTLAGDERDLRNEHEKFVDASAEATELVGDAAAATAVQALESYLTAIGEILGPVLNLLRGMAAGRRLVVVPRAALHPVPFAALRCGDSPLLDVVEDIAVVPTLELVADRLEDEADVVGGVTVIRSTDVPFYAGCANELAALPGAHIIVNPSRDEALNSVQEAKGAVLFACHGAFDGDVPGASWVRVAPGVQIAMTELGSHLMLPTCRTAILGACESGLARATLSSEYVGLPGVLLSAGVPSVVSALWRIDQVASAMLVTELVKALLASGDVPASLAVAQRCMRGASGGDVAVWLRSNVPGAEALADDYASSPEPFANPLYWAGFVAAGLGRPPSRQRATS